MSVWILKITHEDKLIFALFESIIYGNQSLYWQKHSLLESYIEYFFFPLGYDPCTLALSNHGHETKSSFSFF